MKKLTLAKPFCRCMVISAALLFSGCGPPSGAKVKQLFRPSADKDVTYSPEYNFAAFVGTVWKTKTKTAVAELKRYTGSHEVKLLAPQRFDPGQTNYQPPSDMHIIVVLPAGHRLRVARLMQDQGAWGGVQVEAVLDEETTSRRTVYLDPYLLAGNRWSRGPISNTNWNVSTNLLQSPNAK